LKAKEIKLLIMDCDGVFSDGIIAYDNHRVESKNFSAKDGMGVMIAHSCHLLIGMITGRKSEVVAQRCEDLKFDYLYQGIWRKAAAVEEILADCKLSWENVAYIGDDWNDYPVIKRAGLTAAPADAFDDFKEHVDYVCVRGGGKGAVREFIEYILKEQGRYEEVMDKFLADLESIAD